MKSLHTIGLLVVGLAVGALLTWFLGSSRTGSLDRRIETAAESLDHAAMRPLLVTKAKEYEATAALHRRLAEKYTRAAQQTPSGGGGKEGAGPRYTEMATHCLAIAENLEKAASQARALAAGHEHLANPGTVATGR